MRTKIFVTAGILAIIAAAAIAGSLDQTNSPGNAAGRMSTLTEIYNCLNTGNCVSKSTGGFAEPGVGPTAGTGHTLDEIMNLAKQRATQAAVPKSGQTGCWDAGGTSVACAGTGQDGDKLKGVASPSPRFTANTDNNGDGDCTDAGESCNGTVTDNLTGLIWLKDANCATVSPKIWADALTSCNSLASGVCGLTDGSTAGQWRLPNRRELLSLIDDQKVNPALPTGHPFLSVQSDYYWSATTYAGNPSDAWFVYLVDGGVFAGVKTGTFYVWPVRGGQ